MCSMYGKQVHGKQLHTEAQVGLSQASKIISPPSPHLFVLFELLYIMVV